MTQTRISLPILAVLSAAILVAGCHRGFYRRQANAEAQRLIAEKTNDPRWDSATGDISVDPQSRMFNPFSEDHPPMPKDDPSSHQFMHKVDGKPGYSQWHANGDTDFAENPEWLAYLPMNERGEVVIDLDRAVDLAYMHSTVYQSQKEELYLSALDVSIERFDFDGQITTGFNSFFNTRGRLSAGGSSSTLTNQIGANGGGLNWRKLGITGTNFAVGIANTVLWNFAGTANQTTTSLIDFSIIQPFLRGAGRERIMESLTQSERTLLANVRQMDRYRRGFYMQVAVGRSPGSGPSSSGNFLGQPQGAQGPGGFVGLLQSRQQIRNQEFAVRQVKNVLNQFNELFASDQIDNLQLVQVESQLYDSQQSLLSLRRSYQDSLDRFKQTLGIPPHVPVVIDDSFLDRFELTSDEINDRQVRLDELRARTGAALIILGNLLPKNRLLTDAEIALLNEEQQAEYREKTSQDPNRDFASNPDLDQLIANLNPFVDEAIKMVEQVKAQDKTQVDSDFQALRQIGSERTDYLRELQQFVASGQLAELGEIESSLLDPASIASLENYPGKDGKMRPGLSAQLSTTMGKVDQVNQSLESIKRLITEFPSVRDSMSDAQLYRFLDVELLGGIPKQLTDLYNNILELSLIQAQARSNSISLPAINIDAATALEIARCMRLDWMNARASLVDAWREIEFVADQLEADIDLVFEGSLGNVGDNPLKIRTENGSLRAGFRFDSPIIRQSERNAYRQTLIRYQQARRNYYRFEDEVNRNLRQSIRGTNLNKILFELNRRSVQVQIVQVEQARLRLEEPARNTGGTRSGFGNTVAQDLLRAIQGLQRVQDRYLNVWVAYEVARRNLDFDLGTMQLDEMGRWIDPGEIDSTIGHRAAAMMGVDPSCLNCVTINATESSFGGFVAPEATSNDFQRNLIAPGENPIQLRPQLDPSNMQIEPIQTNPVPRTPDTTVPTPDLGEQGMGGVRPIRRNPFEGALERALGSTVRGNDR